MRQEILLTMSNGEKLQYKGSTTFTDFIVPRRIECNGCKYNAPNIPENNLLGFQEGDLGLCIRNKIPKVIATNLKQEISCKIINK